MANLNIDTKSSLQTQTYNYVKDQILTKKLNTNVLYSETKLAAELGISRTPMRESLQCLSQDGYITIIPSKGFMIRQLNEKDMLESIQIRCAIEGFCTHVIASEIESKKGQQLIKTLNKLLDRMKNTKDSNDSHKSFMDYDHNFHLALINYVDNSEFSKTFQRLMYLIQLTTSTALSLTGRIDSTLDEHEQFFHYLKQGNGDTAYNILVKHLMMPLNMHIID
ncbi:MULTISPECIES: GntR family transcriptional regulator [Clostridium]|uniref:GntR family transcriptional regulator n=1 Tax=Clostridium frigoriphilum TaxID=443253 RepID=A0ABU7ULP7_9CLOT|nr:GntR family transcriptional regulator [Clostridium sp. DSM 17811]